MKYILKTKSLTKVYGDNEVINNVNLHIKEGEIYGFLGPNGAGKSTTMKMIMNLTKPTSGCVEIFGSDINDNSYEVLKRIGAIIEAPIFYDKLTARENLILHCEYMGYHNTEDIDRVLEQVELINTGKKLVRNFSMGMKQRLAIARAIITKPEILILDEPINGLDPEGIKKIRSLLLKLSKEDGITIIISSHILSEIEMIADTVGVLKNGKLIKEVSMKEIHDLNGDYIEIEVDDVMKASYVIENVLNITNIKVISDNKIRIYDLVKSMNDISKALINGDVAIDSITKKEVSLEDYFLKLTKEDNHVTFN